ncbi:MAG TPA: pyridine nucleotide-disulfide oxidoreductase [Gammaproteobacteria bacterium]|nr:pyridine nucleotide-disulfide oxidoreductase [Gammaproteobacteria bacterium]
MSFYDWAVIGAGPSGIAAMGNLLDFGVKSDEIVWIDPHFAVGDFGMLWRNVPSNTKVNSFLKFLRACSSFDYQNCHENFPIEKIDPKKTCALGLMADPLLWITKRLREKIFSVEDFAENIVLRDRKWEIQLRAGAGVSAKNIVLAMGAESKQLNYSAPVVVPLQDAVDHERIQQHCEKEDTVAVFGSSHSATLVLRNLVNQGIKRIVNFYRAPMRYAVDMNDWILFDDTGLKGIAAEWARQNIDGKLPVNLERVYSNDENIEHFLPQCNKVVYAIGFHRRALPVVENIGHLAYIKECGIIAPGLFGIGIAFPEGKYNPLGIHEYRVGLSKFMEYLQRIVPVWLKYAP